MTTVLSFEDDAVIKSKVQSLSECFLFSFNVILLLQTNGVSNGLVPMLRVYNNTARYVDQGGNKVCCDILFFFNFILKYKRETTKLLSQ